MGEVKHGRGSWTQFDDDYQNLPNSNLNYQQRYPPVTNPFCDANNIDGIQSSDITSPSYTTDTNQSESLTVVSSTSSSHTDHCTVLHQSYSYTSTCLSYEDSIPSNITSQVNSVIRPHTFINQLSLPTFSDSEYKVQRKKLSPSTSVIHSDTVFGNTPDLRWVVSPEQKAYYLGQFLRLELDTSAKLSGSTAKAYFEMSKLSAVELCRIWDLVDLDCDGQLTLGEFCAAMHLVVLRRNGVPIPEQLPDSLRNLIQTNLRQSHCTEALGSNGSPLADSKHLGQNNSQCEFNLDQSTVERSVSTLSDNSSLGEGVIMFESKLNVNPQLKHPIPVRLNNNNNISVPFASSYPSSFLSSSSSPSLTPSLSSSSCYSSSSSLLPNVKNSISSVVPINMADCQPSTYLGYSGADQQHSVPHSNCHLVQPPPPPPRVYQQSKQQQQQQPVFTECNSKQKEMVHLKIPQYEDQEDGDGDDGLDNQCNPDIQFDFQSTDQSPSPKSPSKFSLNPNDLESPCSYRSLSPTHWSTDQILSHLEKQCDELTQINEHLSVTLMKLQKNRISMKILMERMMPLNAS